MRRVSGDDITGRGEPQPAQPARHTPTESYRGIRQRLLLLHVVQPRYLNRFQIYNSFSDSSSSSWSQGRCNSGRIGEIRPCSRGIAL